MARKKRIPFVPSGTIPRVSKQKHISVKNITESYKYLLREVEKVYPHGLSREQKEHLKEMFLKNPRVTPGEVLKMMGYLSGIGKGKAPPKK